MILAPLSPKQRDSILDSNARLNVWHGAVRSGKTIASLIRWALAIERAGHAGHLVMVGKTLRTLERNSLDVLLDILGPANVRFSRGSGEAQILGRRVLLVGANDERSEQKIRGGTFEALYGDELTLWPESFFRMALSRLSPPGAAFYGTTNPDSPKHWLKAEYLDKLPREHLAQFAFRLSDNLTLDPVFVAALTAENTGLWRKRFIDGLWVAADGSIWDAFDPDLHVFRDLPDGVTIGRQWAAIDYGTANPFVCLVFGLGSDGRTYVLDEWRWDSRERKRQMTDGQYREAIAAWFAANEYRPSRIWVDPSAASFIVECRQHGLQQVGAARNEVMDGLRLVGSRFASGSLLIASRCEGLIREIPGYAWDPKKQDRGEDAPVKVDDHGPDALRYGVATEAAAIRGRVA